jgi:hypothetical protein
MRAMRNNYTGSEPNSIDVSVKIVGVNMEFSTPAEFLCGNPSTYQTLMPLDIILLFQVSRYCCFSLASPASGKLIHLFPYP